MQTTAEPASASRSAEDSVLSALMSIGRAMRQRVPGDELDLGTFWLLKTLSADGPLRVTDLAVRTQLDTSTVSRHVTQLHRAGMIDRTPDPDDGRAQRVALSALGREQLEQAHARRRGLLTKSLAGWDHDDIKELERLLARFVGNIEQMTTNLEQA